MEPSPSASTPDLEMRTLSFPYECGTFSLAFRCGSVFLPLVLLAFVGPPSLLHVRDKNVAGYPDEKDDVFARLFLLPSWRDGGRLWHPPPFYLPLAVSSAPS